MKFLNVHMLQVLPYANVNRDDVGATKTVHYGGVERTRISSQALKRAARVRFETQAAADRTVRSRYTASQVAAVARQLLPQAGEELTDELDDRIAAAAQTEIAKLVSRGGAAGSTLVWLAEREVHAAGEKIAAQLTGGDAPPFVSSSTSSLTIAGFGRMFAQAPKVQCEAAVQVAHAFTTHPAAAELDHFAAVDDLRSSFDDDAGAGHLGVNAAASGSFYRYLNVDRDQLAANWDDLDDTQAADRLRQWYAALLLSLPSGRASSSAAHTLPALVLLEQSSQPLSYAPAFETPVRADGSLALASAQALYDYIARAHRMAANLFGPAQSATTLPGFDQDAATFDQLLDHCVDWTLEAA